MPRRSPPPAPGLVGARWWARGIWGGAPGRLLLECLLSGWLLSIFLSSGCARAAPGPDECVAFAETWLRAHPPRSRLEAEQTFDELVRRCLTEPYDRQLVECVVSGQNQERCRIDYARRVEARREGGER